MKKLLIAAASSMILMAGSASAGLFYVDVGTNFDGEIAPDAGKVCDTCTSMKEEFTFVYDSETYVDDTDGSGTISAGDQLITNGGLAVGGFDLTGLSTNLITSFQPTEILGTNSNNGLNSDYYISFSVTNLPGMIVGINDQGDADPSNDVPLLAYGAGLIEFFITFDGVTFNNFMDINISAGGATGLGTVLFGEVDFSDVDGGYNNLFNSGTNTCEGATGFYDIWLNCGGNVLGSMDISLFSSQDTNVLLSDFGAVFDPETEDLVGFAIASNHDGSATFNVPEPSTVALMGASLLLMGGLARRSRKS